jgi:NhaP-type Na+/H+ or K+/H+ antiporter
VTAGEGWSTHDLLLLVAVLLVYAVLARTLARIWVSAALFFLIVGLLMGPSSLGWYESPIGSDGGQLLASLALATVLFGDATRVRVRQLRENAALPSRLLTIGLLGTIAVGAVVGHVMFGSLTWAVALVVAVMLAPTDAALGSPVNDNRSVPSRVREALFVESGLNDGIAVPFLVFALALADMQEMGDAGLLQIVFMKLVVSAIVGAAIAFVAYGILHITDRRSGEDAVWTSLIPLLTAIVTFLAVEHIEGSGFIAAFAGGLTFGALARAREISGVEVDEAVSSLLQGVTWFLFGALVVGPVLLSGTIDPAWVAYGVLSLTLVRMLPVALALLGTHQDWRTVLFVGWFGPRGLASVVFLLIVLGLSPLAADATIIRGVVTVTVLMSVVLHGISATPLVNRYARSRAAPKPAALTRDDSRG